jgi:hypothetical protein
LTGCSELHCIANAKFIVAAVEHCEYGSAFIQFLKRLNDKRRIGNLFFDEVDQLLHGNKPDYRPCLSSFWSFRSRLISIGIQMPLVGLTATLRQCDVSKLSELISGIPNSLMPVFRRSCFRPSITFEMLWANSDSDAQQLCRDTSLAHAASVGKTIVFATSLHEVNSLAADMKCQAIISGVEFDVERFDASKIIAASSCAGHGLDLRAISLVSILGVPFDAETCVQWAGRIREFGAVKIFLNERRVNSIAKLQDRRGELARVFLEKKGMDPHQACCNLIDCETGSSSQQQTQAVVKNVQISALNLEPVVDLKYHLLAFISSIPTECCKVCYILGDRSGNFCGVVCRKFSGLCIKCFDRHSSRDCTRPRFTMPGRGLCYKCFLPFEKGIGPDLHSGYIGAHCTSPMCDVLPRVAAILFHSKSIFIPQRLHGDFQAFVAWVAAVEKDSGLYGILKLLKALVP